MVTSTSVYHSSPLKLDTIRNAAIQIEWTGTPSGTLIIEGSVDGTTYYDIQASIPTQPAGSPSGVLLNIVDVGFRDARVTYTNSTGTGHITAKGMGKT